MFLPRVPASRALPVAAGRVAAPLMVRLSHQRPSAPGPHPKEDEVLAEVKQLWKKARFAKNSDTATVLGVRCY